MVKVFKESHEKDVEKLAVDRLCEDEKKTKDALEKAGSPDMTKRVLKTRTQMVEIMYKYFDEGLSESHRAKLNTQVHHNTHLCTACM
jgi:hypothetical protein